MESAGGVWCGIWSAGLFVEGCVVVSGEVSWRYRRDGLLCWTRFACSRYGARVGDIGGSSRTDAVGWFCNLLLVDPCEVCGGNLCCASVLLSARGGKDVVKMGEEQLEVLVRFWLAACGACVGAQCCVFQLVLGFGQLRGHADVLCGWRGVSWCRKGGCV